MKDLFMALAGHLRASQLYYHYMHHTASGACFAADHKMFKSFYQQAEDAYDRVIEYALGHATPIADPLQQMETIHAVLEVGDAVEMEKQLQSICDMFDEKEISIALETLVGDIAQEGSVRLYKLQQRAK